MERQMMRASRITPVLGGLIALAMTGCGGGGGDTIRGIVTQDGEPVAGLTVELLRGGEEEPAPGEEGVVVETTTTNADGRFAFDAEPGEYAVNVDLPMEGTGGCTALMPFVGVEEGSTATADFDVPAEPPSGIVFIDPFWFACFAP